MATERQLIELAASMREHQKRYTKTRTEMDLYKAQQAEQRFDKELDEYLHPSLFSGHGDGQ